MRVVYLPLVVGFGAMAGLVAGGVMAFVLWLLLSSSYTVTR